ncbi:MAG: helix-turn-helix domain-containing protein [Candidatus Bathyarchaeia archaeon]
MAEKEKYSIIVRPECRLVEIRFSSPLNLDLMEEALGQLRGYLAEEYRIKIISYVDRSRNYIRAFMLALSLFGYEDRVIFENKARYSKAERRRRKEIVRELKNKGYSAKRIAEHLNIPLKTIYRWLTEMGE